MGGRPCPLGAAGSGSRHFPEWEQGGCDSRPEGHRSHLGALSRSLESGRAKRVADCPGLRAPWAQHWRMAGVAPSLPGLDVFLAQKGGGGEATPGPEETPAPGNEEEGTMGPAQCLSWDWPLGPGGRTAFRG